MSEATAKACESHLYACVHEGSHAQSVLAAAASTRRSASALRH
jgi:hypothetical protein